MKPKIFPRPLGERQVVVVLSFAELVYFELDLDSQLNEYQERKAMGSTVLALFMAKKFFFRIHSLKDVNSPASSLLCVNTFYIL